MIDVVGMFTHLSTTSEHDDMAQIGKFEAAVGEARDAGLSPRIRHLTASDGSLSYPDAHYEMVRVGAALYGLDPFSAGRAGEWGLRPVMTAKSSVVQVKRVEAGHGVSYGYLHKTDRASTLALVPVGYAEGLPRDATRHVRVLLNNRLYPILARIAMDQFVLDVGDDLVEVGDEVVLFGDPRTGASSVDDFAAACSTINYEIVTRMGGRFKRVYVGGE
jgi:alanine racemase